MIDNFTLLLTHGLMFLAAWRLLSRPDLDDPAAQPPPPAAPRGFLRKREEKPGA